jgi:hypothetical protein
MGFPIKNFRYAFHIKILEGKIRPDYRRLEHEWYLATDREKKKMINMPP